MVLTNRNSTRFFIILSLFKYDIISYGVIVPGYEGRAGMLAILRSDSADMIDVKKLAVHVIDNLPTYARPLFLRIINHPKNWTLVTSTLKHRKVELQR